MFKKYVLALTVLLAGIFAFPAFSQESDEWYYNKPIKSVTFNGLQNIKSSDLDGITSAYVGKPFTYDLFADLLNRIFALDYFEDVSPEAVPGDAARKTVQIVLVVKENPVVSKVVFLGNSQVKNNELKDAVSVKAKDIYIQSKVLVDERAIRNLYISKGFTSAQVSSTVEEGSDGMVVTFRIDEGTTTVVTDINFEGNTIASERTLKSKLSLKEAGVFNKGYFQESSLEADSQALVAYYRDRGYIDARIVDILRESTLNEAKKRDELTITFIIQEGSQYTFGGVNFLGNKVFTTEQIESLVLLKPGDVYNDTKFQESLMQVQQLYISGGYTSNQFQSYITKDPETKTVSYQIVIEERDRSHVESVIVKGNERTKDYVIQREIPIESGDIYSSEKLLTALRSLYNLQYFSNIVPDVQMGSEENLVDVIFNVEEQNTVTLNLGLTFSGVSNPNQFPIAFMASIQDSNLFGEGKAVSASVNVSTEEQSISLGYGQSWLFGLPISLNVSTGFSHTKNYANRLYLGSEGENYSDYMMEYHQLSFNLGASLSRWWTYDWATITVSGGISGSMVKNLYDTDLFTPLDYSISAYGNNWSPTTAVFAKLSLDGRDINYDPSSGWFTSEQLTWRGLFPRAEGSNFGETEFFLRSETKAEYYFTLLDKRVTENWNFKLVLALYSGLSFQIPAAGTTIKDSSKLYIDGMFYGRGYSIYNNPLYRGDVLFANYAEIRFPFVPGVLSFDLFFDAITVRKDLNTFFKDFAASDSWFFSWGPSLRITMQQFPLRLLFTNTFKVGSSGLQWVDKYGAPVSGWQAYWRDSWNFTLSFNLVNR